VWEVIGHASGFIDWYGSWQRFAGVLLSSAGFQQMKVLGEKFKVVSGAMSCFAAAAVNYLSVRKDPLSDIKDLISEMVFHRIAEKIAISCKDMGFHEIERSKIAFNLRST
jgi:hypothetical protein